uniref:uncharacterized protein LOC100177004 isoform X1 n=1 Tax=Ciona intestinalis TaxID=7719 RepID=UPI00089DBE41|nr:uncharacterized protein LOC100177004 isoform X1 [Ciona intestinalis]|eukprot:XP_009858961.2 uncharacterized protein LOC100177004 isoform X1 [Ciona intestinalis]
MNTTALGLDPPVQLSCWPSILTSSTTDKRTSEIIAIVFLAVVASLNCACSLGCIIVVAATPKLHKTAWFLRASMAAKDLVLSSTMTGFALWNILVQKEVTDTRKMNPIIFICSVVYITCFAASFVHIMILSFDRHQVIARPFRYHTGELLPPKVAAILIGSGWTFCFVIGLSVTSQSVEQAERDNDLKIDGSLFPVYRISGVQKWLLGCGMLMVFVITVQMLVSAMVIVNKRAKERKLQLLTGVGIPEPLQSRNNSVCHVTNKSKINQSTVIDDSNENSEADANDFLLSGGFGKGLLPNPALWGKEETKPEVTIFTPVNYRPSILRRIRDTWALYSTIFCSIVFTLTNFIPFYILIIFDPPGSSTIVADNTVRYDVIPFSYCVTCAIFELLLAGQGIAYVIIYIITDDEFRPAILKPFSAIGCTKTYRKPRRKYSIDRRRSRVESGVDYNGAGLQMRTTNSGD